ncbi:MAG: hypothetical protein ACXIVQ_01945 [Acidimicrobiales bacterium]
MPWCERCDRFLNPNTVAADGTCPSCGRTVDAPEAGPRPARPETDGHQTSVHPPATEDPDSVKAPWHFWVMVIAAVGYLGWRGVEAVIWLIQQITSS